MLGARLLASCSNCALVITVLQSAEDLVGVLSDAGLAEVPLAAAGLGWGAHTPSMVSTGALAGTDAEVSTGAGGVAAVGGGPAGAACPHAIVVSKAHSTQLLPITHF